MTKAEVFTASRDAPPRDRLASYLGAIGRGPGRSRPLTAEEAEDAFRIVLDGEADPMQVGALLLLMRFRGESAPELAGLVRAARAYIHAPGIGSGIVDLDWPTYAAGRSRGAPWFLLSALLVARAGYKVALHGHDSAFLEGVGSEIGARELDIPVCTSLSDTQAALAEGGIVFLPLQQIAPELHRLIGLRSILGLRSPVNSLVRLLNPLGASASLVGVFHPSYRDLHRDTAGLLGWRDLSVVKGSGGEAEPNPFKTAAVHRLVAGKAVSTDLSPMIAETRGERAPRGTLQAMLAVWRGEAQDEAAEATVIGTAALALATLQRSTGAGAQAACRAQATSLWRARREHVEPPLETHGESPSASPARAQGVTRSTQHPSVAP
jgi:anthranilate phosphoribosyltransferase